jgi:hypothetical protein
MKKKLTLKKYYKTKHWKKIRSDFAFGENACCEICGAKRWGVYKRGPKKGKRKPKQEHHIHLHHKHYETLFEENRNDFMLLCDSCHKFGHMLEKLKNKNKFYKDIYIQFVKETGWEFKKRRCL